MMTELIEKVARGIAGPEHGFGRGWDDFLPTNAHDIDQDDLLGFAKAAIEAISETHHIISKADLVKPLVWKMVTSERWMEASTPLGVYTLLARECDGWVLDFDPMGVMNRKVAIGPVLENAQDGVEAAQSDHDARVTALLNIEGQA